MTDLMAWNADATRMPYRMHAEYLRRLFLDNDLAEGRFMVGGTAGRARRTSARRCSPSAPSATTSRRGGRSTRSTFTTDTDVTFVLTSGGHNAGIVSAPGHQHRHFRIAFKRNADTCLDPDEWAAAAVSKDGSWWVDWADWLAGHSAPERVSPPDMGAAGKGYKPIEDAPGSYVLQR